jgi:hypothetical protein
LRANPAISFSIEELARAAYLDARAIDKKHRVAVLRTLANVDQRIPLVCFSTCRPPWSKLVSQLNAQSYAHGWLRAERQQHSLAKIEAMLNVREVRNAMEPGGYFWCVVENQIALGQLRKLGFREGMREVDMSPKLRPWDDSADAVNYYCACIPAISGIYLNCSPCELLHLAEAALGLSAVPVQAQA